MKFKLDEHLPVELLGELWARGQDADTVADEGMAGAPDAAILPRARDDGRILITMDKGIGDVREYPPELFGGIVLVRPPTSGRKAVQEFLRPRWDALIAHAQPGKLVVVTERGLRVR
ncbi:MAG: hypothetical protein EXR77_02950 [Myxococcales bacterium]|nr:hypothetical protein [Myxococcales bacterium]